MIPAIHALNFILPALYLATLLAYTRDFFSESESFTNSKRLFLFVTLIIHTIYLLMRTIEFDHAPITNKFEIFTLLAFSIAFSYFLLELLSDIRGTGIFILIFSLVFQIISTIFIQDLMEVKEVLRDRLLGLHVISALLGYSGVTISAVYAVLFTVQYKRIKGSNFGLVFSRLPNLELLEKLSWYSVVIGTVLLTIAILIGIIWLPQAFPHFRYSDPKLVGTILVWIIYITGITLRITGQLYSKKFMLFSIAGFVVAMISLFITSTFAESFHTFY
ncbi:MAG: cytochrome c biogenesis protein [Ignavibacteriaceae bacterium]|nr:cytochrome c biogenesis protein [Ignavibacteriaceae bacterium]